MGKPLHWGCEIRIDHTPVLTLESNHVSGIELTSDDEETIKMIAEHLLAFIGRRTTDAPENE